MPAAAFIADSYVNPTAPPVFVPADRRRAGKPPQTPGGRSASRPMLDASLNSEPRFAKRHCAPTNAPPRYDHVLVVADFTRTSDEFHRRLIALGSVLGARLSLLQLDSGGIAAKRDASAEILLEGLRHRLGISPERCAIARPQALDRFLRGESTDSGGSSIVIVGTGASSPKDDGAGSWRCRTPCASCDVIEIEDTPDWY